MNKLIDTAAKTRGSVNITHFKKENDESEYSLEMQLPFIMKVFKDAGRLDHLKIVPLMIGDLPKPKYKLYADVLLPLFMQERTIFIVSSDFCHWGWRFQFTPNKDRDAPKIHNFIE